MNHDDVLNDVYEEALLRVSKDHLTVDGIKDDDVGYLDLIVERSESNKGMVAVLTTLLTHKICTLEQDIKSHGRLLMEKRKILFLKISARRRPCHWTIIRTHTIMVEKR